MSTSGGHKQDTASLSSPEPIEISGDKSGNFTKFDLTNEESGMKTKYEKEDTEESPDFSNSMDYRPVREKDELATGGDDGAMSSPGAAKENMPENVLLVKEVKILQHQLNEYAQGEEELIDFNKELQWTVMMMKKDNDAMRESLDFLLQGGDPKKLEEDQLQKMLGTSVDKLKTPKVDNVFEAYSEF